MSGTGTAFITGSSIAMTFVTLIYVGVAFRRAGRPASVPYELIAIFVPLFYGIANIINVRYGNTLQSAAIVGALLGLLFSLVGRFKLDLPAKIFGMSPERAPIVHIIAPLLYATIFVFLVRPFN